MSQPEPPGGSLTFFFSDVEASTRLASELGDAFAERLEEHRRVVRAALEENDGTEVSTGGDSFFAVFGFAADAVAAAAAIQRTLAERSASTDPSIRVRIGLHSGQAVRVGKDYVGLDVHRAARIADAGNGGQILISETTRAALGGRPPGGLTLQDLGRHRLKDIGPERLWQVEGPGLASGPFRLRSLEAHPTNLPVAGSPLLDRERERSDLAELISGASIVTVTGAGGIGKSRLAIEVARSLVAGFPDGVFYLDLASTPDAAGTAASLVDVMALRTGPDEDPSTAVLDRLRSRDLLLVLDTADRVAGLPALAANIAASCPRIRILVTSRSRLRVGAERELSLPPLQTDPSVELFVSRAKAVRPGFALDGATRPVVERLIERLDGIPLAIELAAARTRLFSPAALLDRLERHLPVLGEGGRDLPDRQRTLQDTIDWSVELLHPAEQATFRQLGVFAGSFELSAVEGVAIVPEGRDPIGLLETLVDRSLVVTEVGTEGGTRFRLLAPIREFARDALRASGSETAIRDRHGAYWRAFVREQTDALEVGTMLGAVKAIGLEEPDIRLALEWSLSVEEPGGPAARRAAIGLEIAGRLGRYWRLRGRVQEGLSWLTRSLAAAPDGPPTDRALALFWTGVLYDDAGQPIDATARLDEALAIRRSLADEAGIARILNSLGVVARSTGDLDRAETLLKESIERKQALGDRAGEGVSLSNLGVLAADRRQHATAVEFMARALEIDEEIGAGTVVVARANLGAALIRAGRFEEGLTHLRRSLPGIEELEDPELVTETLRSLAMVAHAFGTPGSTLTAARLLCAADALRELERIPLRDVERSEIDALQARISEKLDPSVLAEVRAEARAVDFVAGIALARDALGETADTRA